MLAAKYRHRPDFIENRWLSARDVLIYEGLTKPELLARIRSHELEVRIQADGKPLFLVAAAWKWDECFLRYAGGQCFAFEPHQGAKISSLVELEGTEGKHPNLATLPTDDDIEAIEVETARLLEGAENAPRKGP